VWSHVCVCVCVRGGGCLRDPDHVIMSKCMYARVRVCMHACIHVCVHACMCMCVCAGAGLRAQVEDVVHEARQARERAEVAARRSGATTGVYWLPVYGLVYCVSVYLCISTHAWTCMHSYVRAYVHVSYA
jgi:hypothetical protein